LRDITDEHLIPVVDSLLEILTSSHHDRITISGKAWVHYALACMKLYVPNVAFDPAMQSMVERQRHLARKSEITSKIGAEKLFEIKFSGQEDNHNIQMLEQRLVSLGEEPPNSLIARPIDSEMSSLQGELSNVLRVVVDSQPHYRLLNSILQRAGNFRAQEALFQANLSQLLERLEKGYPMYKDMVDPVLGFIYYLKLGLSLVTMTSESSSDTADTKSFLAPYDNISQRPRMPQAVEHEAQMLWLRQYAARSSTESYECLEQPVRENIHSIFQKLFRKWKSETVEEKEKAIVNRSLYNYRGEVEDHDKQEFQEMFPSYEDESPEEVKEQKEPRLLNHKDVAIRIAQCQSALFTTSTDVNLSLSTLVHDGASIWMKTMGDSSATFTHAKIEEFLPAIFLSLKDTTKWVKGERDSFRRYDFYTHENLEQAHKLVSIVKAIHKRMVYLLEMWPENVTLQDAVESCQQLFDFPSTTPVARFLTKIEKLHGILNEWQGVASKEFTAAEQYNTLSQLIISWRRLELTTWPQLFDLEDEKVKQNALSWWFFLYESIVANPIELLTEDLKNHIHQLIANLINWVSMSSIGQFSHRLQLLRVFEQHIARLIIDIPDMELVRRALQSFILYYSQYESAVAETLKWEREKMEKVVADVVLLASWKDTNIIALRDSAKRSHHKLYKTVRKYRQLLDNPVSGIISSGMTGDDKTTFKNPVSVDPKVDAEAVKKIYEVSVQGWNSRPLRLCDLPGAVGIMQRVSKIARDKVDVVDFFDRFSTSIITTTKELQAETPAMMSEEVKDVIKHLKTRKRKAFTDSLKELRQMGLKSNLSTAQLQKQASLEKILATAASLEQHVNIIDISGIQHYFVRILEILLKAQNLKDSSPDLQGNDVSRVVGFMQHLLSINLEQRASLCSALGDLSKTRTATEQYRELSDMRGESTLHGKGTLTTTRFSDALRKVRWLPKLLDFTLILIQIRSEFTGTAAEKVEKDILEWKQQAMDLSDQLASEKLVHSRIWQASTKALVDKCEEYLAMIRSQISQLIAQSPEIRYVMMPLLQWASPLSAQLDEDEDDAIVTSIMELDASLQKLADSIFVALQKLKEAQSALPSNTIEAGWLLNYQTASAASLKALHMRNISYKIENAITQASHLQPFTTQISLAVRAVFAAYFPIVQEYVNTCQRTLQQTAAANRSISKATFILCTTANTILSKGFCEPAEQGKAGESNGQLESGIGLGEGQGAEDISKDIKLDEDLSELAQEKDKEEREDEIEDEEDAVDMGDDEMEGEMGDKKEKGDEEEDGSDNGEEENEVGEETGDVDDLDPTAVDEKIWDEKADDNDKEKEGDTKGKKEKGDELEAKKEHKEQRDTGEQGDEVDDGDEDEEGGAEENDDVRQQDTEGMDEHAPEVDTLELPEDMNLDRDESEDESDGPEEDGDDMDMDDLPDVAADEEPIQNDGKGEDQEDKFPELDAPEKPETAQTEEKEGEDEDEEMGEEQGDGVEDPDNTDEPENLDDNLLTQQPKDKGKESEETTPSDLQGTQGGADNKEKADQTSAQQENGEESKSDEPQQGQGTEKNESQRQDQEAGAASAQDKDPNQEPQKPQDKASEEEQTFQKVGDILEKWHRQRKQILNANEENTERPQLDNMVGIPGEVI